jgi:hypothetical protein
LELRRLRIKRRMKRLKMVTVDSSRLSAKEFQKAIFCIGKRIPW